MPVFTPVAAVTSIYHRRRLRHTHRMTEPPDSLIQGNLTPEQHEAMQQLVFIMQDVMQRLSGFWVLNAEGEPEPATDPFAFMDMVQDPRRQIERTIICDGVLVSTVFLNIDHSFESGTRPVLWETMVFDERPRERNAAGIKLVPNFDGHSCRYSSRDDAVAGHKRIVAMVREAIQVGSKCHFFQQFFSIIVNGIDLSWHCRTHSRAASATIPLLDSAGQMS